MIPEGNPIEYFGENVITCHFTNALATSAKHTHQKKHRGRTACKGMARSRRASLWRNLAHTEIFLGTTVKANRPLLVCMLPNLQGQPIHNEAYLHEPLGCLPDRC